MIRCMVESQPQRGLGVCVCVCKWTGTGMKRPGHGDMVRVRRRNGQEHLQQACHHVTMSTLSASLIPNTIISANLFLSSVVHTCVCGCVQHLLVCVHNTCVSRCLCVCVCVCACASLTGETVGSRHHPLVDVVAVRCVGIGVPVQGARQGGATVLRHGRQDRKSVV